MTPLDLLDGAAWREAGSWVSAVCVMTPSVADYRDTSPESGEGIMN